MIKVDKKNQRRQIFRDGGSKKKDSVGSRDQTSPLNYTSVVIASDHLLQLYKRNSLMNFLDM
jgi:hypothetical protein